jgi:serine/threonine protein kinase
MPPAGLTAWESLDSQFQNPGIRHMTALKAEHPDNAELSHFNLGRLEPDRQADVEKHVDTCCVCSENLKTLTSGDDDFVSLLREARQYDPVQSPQTGTISLAVSSAATHLESETDYPVPHPQLLSDSARALADHPRYRVVGVLGRGGMGAVYKAEHRAMNRLVALKVLNAEYVRNPDAIHRFRREARAAARLNHPNIVTAYDAEQTGDHHFLVMEFVEGVTLAEEVKRLGRLPVDHACRYMYFAALGLQHAAETGMVHRDIKPHNLMVTPDGRLKVLDFGLASFAGDSAARGELTAHGTFMGTPDYVAPEQADDASTADVRSDIYSLGATFYFLLTGQVPFPEPSVMKKLAGHMSREPRSVTEFRDDIPVEVVQAVRRMMAKEPSARFQRPFEVANALRPLVHDPAPLQSPAVVPEHDSSTVTPASARDSERETSPAAIPVPPRAGAGTSIRLLGGILALFLAGAVYWIQTDNGTVVIKTEASDVEVHVTQDGELITIIDTATERKFQLKSGKYGLRLASGESGFELSTNELMLERDGVKIVEVRKVKGLPGSVGTANPAAEAATLVDFNAKPKVVRDYGNVDVGSLVTTRQSTVFRFEYSTEGPAVPHCGYRVATSPTAVAANSVLSFNYRARNVSDLRLNLTLTNQLLSWFLKLPASDTWKEYRLPLSEKYSESIDGVTIQSVHLTTFAARQDDRPLAGHLELDSFRLESPAVVESLTAAMAPVYKAMRISNAQVSGGPHAVGDTVTIKYNLTNTSAQDLQIPIDRSYSRPFRLVGVHQHWVERQGKDSTIPSLAKGPARKGRLYAAGGSIIPTDAVIPAGMGPAFSPQLNTTGYPPGDYKFVIEYKAVRGDVIETSEVDFTLGEAKSDKNVAPEKAPPEGAQAGTPKPRNVAQFADGLVRLPSRKVLAVGNE